MTGILEHYLAFLREGGVEGSLARGLVYKNDFSLMFENIF